MDEILTQLSMLHIRLWVDGDQLRYSAPRGAMNEALRAELLRHKMEIITHLKKIGQEGGAARPGITLSARPERLPLSYAQEQPWLEDHLSPGNTANNMFYAFRLRGPLDVPALAWGFEQVVARHEILRTAFKLIDGQPWQVIVPSPAVSLPVIDVSARPDGEAERLAQEEAKRPFDLSLPPLVRCSLLRLTESEHVLLLTMHHIVSDGRSVEVLFQELILFSQLYISKRSYALPALPFQYADFTVWQRNWLQGQVLGEQIDYWRKQLANAPLLLELPTDRKRPDVQTHHGARLPLIFSRELTDDLKVLGHREDATLFMILLAGFQALLSRWSGQTDICVGSPVANRKQPELEGLIGFFANTLVFRADLSGDPDLRQLLQRVREVCLGAYDHQDIPFKKLVDELGIPCSPSYTPLFQVMFNLQNTQADSPDIAGLVVEPLEVDRNTTHFDLRMSLQEMPSGLTGFIKYNTDLFDRETILLLNGLYQQILESWVHNPNQPLSAICLPEALRAKAEAARGM